MALALDHLVILVPELAEAVADYERLGFAVTPGGTHADGLTHNALIVFADGTYVELIAFVDAEDRHDNVWGWRGFADRGGLIDYCAKAEDLTDEIARLRGAGLSPSEAVDGGRQRPDGVALRWQSARFWQVGRQLPFLIGDLTPHELRVPKRSDPHPNGATGIAELIVAVADLERGAGQLAALIGTTPGERDQRSQLDAATRSLPWGTHTLTIAEPTHPQSPVQRHLEQIGPGPFGLVLRTADKRGRASLDARHTQGVRITLR